MARVDAQTEVALVVAQLDVVARLVLLDEAVLEDGRLFLRCGDDRLEVAHRALEQRDEVALVP